jgi:hypothetical protein
MAMTPGTTIPGQGVGLFPSQGSTSCGSFFRGRRPDSTVETARRDLEKQPDSTVETARRDLEMRLKNVREADDKSESDQRKPPKRKRAPPRSDDAKAKRTTAEAHAKRSKAKAMKKHKPPSGPEHIF